MRCECESNLFCVSDVGNVRRIACRVVFGNRYLIISSIESKLMKYVGCPTICLGDRFISKTIRDTKVPKVPISARNSNDCTEDAPSGSIER